MIRQYDEIAKMKLKEMSRTISDMTLCYLNSETGKSTIVHQNIMNKLLY